MIDNGLWINLLSEFNPRTISWLWHELPVSLSFLNHLDLWNDIAKHIADRRPKNYQDNDYNYSYKDKVKALLNTPWSLSL